MSQSLAGRVAIVTGAGSLPGRGIGRGIVESLASKGASVLAVDIDGATANETAIRLQEQNYDVTAFQADVTRLEDIKAMTAGAAEKFGRIDILVNHAGFGSFLSLTETDDDHWNKMIALNLTGPFLTSREVLPHLLKNATGGVILNTISSAGVSGGRAGLAYTAAKHGLVGLTRNIAVSYAGRGIRCVGVCPGYTRSPLPEGTRAQIDPADSHDDARRVFEGISGIASRQGRPEELAKVIGFLATDEASFINGAVIPVDGGWTAI